MRCLYIYIVLIGCLILSSCARIVTPSGGERDIKAPEYVGSYPKLNALNFKGDKIEVYFDEYIVLDNATGKLIVSPPLKNKPTIGSKLKTLYVKGLDSLQENTTYIFDFGDAVTDYTEGNRLSHFSFAFSTGDNIDTMFYAGRLLNAYSLKPEANKFVTLYRNKDISYMRENIPDYITRTDSNGRFYFRNIKQGDYFLLAFEDMNQNMIYDLVTEGYGCKANVLIDYPSYSSDIATDEKTKTQTDKANSTQTKNKESVLNDTILYNTAEDTVQKILASKIINEREFYFVTSLPVSESLSVTFSKPLLDRNEYALYRNKNNDTITVTATSNKLFDTVKAEVTDLNGFSDKLDLSYIIRKRRNKEEQQSFYILFNEKEIPFFQNITLEFPTVVNTQKYPHFEGVISSSSDTNRIIFTSNQHNPKQYVSNFKLKEDSDYTLWIDSAVVYAYDGRYNDTLRQSFHVTTQDDYGSFAINIRFADSNSYVDTLNGQSLLLLTLFDEKDNEIQTINRHVDSVTRALFENLREGKYKLRLIVDTNGNKKWDRGDFDTQKEAEKVIYFNKSISVRKGWQSQEDWIVR